MPPAPDFVGFRFGRLTVLSRAGTSASGKALWTCKCDCGRETAVETSRLRNGNTSSCGCLRLEVHTVHGLSRHPLFHTWRKMMARCYDPAFPAYARYGAVGITVCERWRDLANFVADNEGQKTKGLTLDRISNLGPYSPENCRWATALEQTLNRSITRLVEYSGKTQCITHWERELGFPVGVLANRIRAGMSMSEAIAKGSRRRKII